MNLLTALLMTEFLDEAESGGAQTGDTGGMGGLLLTPDEGRDEFRSKSGFGEEHIDLRDLPIYEDTALLEGITPSGQPDEGDAPEGDAPDEDPKGAAHAAPSGITIKLPGISGSETAGGQKAQGSRQDADPLTETLQNAAKLLKSDNPQDREYGRRILQSVSGAPEQGQPAAGAQRRATRPEAKKTEKAPSFEERMQNADLRTRVRERLIAEGTRQVMTTREDEEGRLVTAYVEQKPDYDFEHNPRDRRMLELEVYREASEEDRKWRVQTEEERIRGIVEGMLSKKETLTLQEAYQAANEEHFAEVDNLCCGDPSRSPAIELADGRSMPASELFVVDGRVSRPHQALYREIVSTLSDDIANLLNAKSAGQSYRPAFEITPSLMASLADPTAARSPRDAEAALRNNSELIRLHSLQIYIKEANLASTLNGKGSSRMQQPPERDARKAAPGIRAAQQPSQMGAPRQPAPQLRPPAPLAKAPETGGQPTSIGELTQRVAAATARHSDSLLGTADEFRNGFVASMNTAIRNGNALQGV